MKHPCTCPSLVQSWRRVPQKFAVKSSTLSALKKQMLIKRCSPPQRLRVTDGAELQGNCLLDISTLYEVIANQTSCVTCGTRPFRVIDNFVTAGKMPIGSNPESKRRTASLDMGLLLQSHLSIFGNSTAVCCNSCLLVEQRGWLYNTDYEEHGGWARRIHHDLSQLPRCRSRGKSGLAWERQDKDCQKRNKIKNTLPVL